MKAAAATQHVDEVSNHARDACTVSSVARAVRAAGALRPASVVLMRRVRMAALAGLMGCLARHDETIRASRSRGVRLAWSQREDAMNVVWPDRA